LGGFQFDVEGATILSAAGGDAGAAGFMISASATTVLGFSLTGASFSGCGTLVELELDGVATGISNIVISDPAGLALSFEYFDGSGGGDVEGCTDMDACNYNSEATIDDGSCLENDCTGECGGSAVEDECGVCGGDGIADGACDCAGNVDLGCGCGEDGPSGCDNQCGSNAVEDECGVCDGNGANVECWDGSMVCNSLDCPDNPSGWDGDACSMPDHSLHITNHRSVLYNSSSDIAGFQFNVDGASVLSAAGGDAGAAGFMISASATTVLGFSLTGASFSGCGTLVELELDGVATGISNIVISDPAGLALSFEYFEIYP
jgi:hypothetical protein